MPMSYRIDAGGVVHIHASGALTDAHLFDLRERLAVDPALRPGAPRLADIREVDRLEVTPDGIHRLVAMEHDPAQPFSARRIAIVVSGDLPYGMARMYEALSSETPAAVRVFRDLDEARAWLGLG